MNIAFFGYDEGGCGHYRALSPMSAISRHKKAKVVKIAKGDGLEMLNETLINADVVFAPHLSDERIISILEAVKADGKKMVVDFDDDMFNISPLSPHYEECGTKNVLYKFPNGSEVKLWEDGVTPGFSIKKNEKYLSNIKKAVEMADLVTTTTETLANKFSKLNDNVKVLPNCVDLNVWKNYDIKRSNEIRLYWAGGSSHYEDWCVLSEVLPCIMEKYKNVKLVLMGHQFHGTLKKIPKDRIEFHAWVPTPAYPYKSILNCPDIALIPLRQTGFNECKSAIKWIEMSALGVPSVATAMSPYIDMDTGNNGIFIEDNDKEGWIEGISILVEDSVLRAKMGGEARRFVEDNYDINKNYMKWLDAYRGLFH